MSSSSRWTVAKRDRYKYNSGGQHQLLETPVLSISLLSSTIAMAVSNRRLKVMEALDQRMEELEEFQQYGEEYKNLLEETDLLEDENYLYDLERHRRHLERESLVGTIWEPSLVFCWVILSVVLFYVGFLIVAGDQDRQFIKEEL